MNASVACGFAPHDRAEPELFGSEYGTWFEDRLVVEAYPARPPYPSALIAHLVWTQRRGAAGCARRRLRAGRSRATSGGPDAPLQPPYTLITAGQSLHWFDWELVMPRCAQMLTPPGVRFAAVQTCQNVSLLHEPGRRQLFELHAQKRFGPEPWQPTVDEYILAGFSQRSFSRTHIGPEATSQFAAALREALADIPTVDGRLQLEVSAGISWGRPRG